jgi:hypothetical protein
MEQEEQRQRLKELVAKSRERLRRWPSWITSGSQAEFDQWLLTGERSSAKRRAIGDSTSSL